MKELKEEGLILADVKQRDLKEGDHVKIALACALLRALRLVVGDMGKLLQTLPYLGFCFC